MPTTIPLDKTDRAALEAVLTTGQSVAAAVALELALAEAITVTAGSVRQLRPAH